MSKKNAIVIGATGLTGFQLTKKLIEDGDFIKVKVLTRRKTGLQSKKLEEVLVDFDNLEKYSDFIKGDVLFSCLGTTIKKAGSKEVQYKVDYTYQYNVAKVARDNEVGTYVLVSSSGANSKSSIFYSKIKGKLEDKVKDLSFERCFVFQPSVLMGERNEKRRGEVFAAKIVNFFAKIFPFVRKYRGIDTSILAQSMINAYKSQEKNATYILGEIFDIK
jgi:uncharacterized protein YbjT (DUF2867 family)